jgi:hypothetical protein
MNVYDYITTFSEAVRDDSAVQAYCIEKFGKGCLVQVDDDIENMIGSDAAPYCLFVAVPGTEDNPVAENGIFNIAVEVGTMPTGEPPYYSDDTERTASANGLRIFGQGEICVDLMELVLTACKAATLSACSLIQTSTIDASGSLYFPLALAVSQITVSESKDLGTFS